jgi:CheY-like chemotaxis protein
MHPSSQPLTSFLSGLECMTEVVAAWEVTLRDSAKLDPAAFARTAADGIQVLDNCLKNMRGSNSFMTMTINRCIDYTKASKGVKLVPKLETADLRHKLAIPVDLMRTVQSAIEVKVLPLDADICTHIITDRQWLLENLLCLLSNAVKYSHRGTVEVAVKLEQWEAEPKLRFEVQDTGIGLSEEAKKSLFNPFKQAQRLAGGTGLGLFSLAKRVEALHGQYGVGQRPDGAQGSLFWFTIPYRPDRQTARLASLDLKVGFPSGSSEGGMESTRSLTPMDSPREDMPSALVVDDAPMIVKMTNMLLTRKGHVVDIAVNGAAALEKLLQGYEKLRHERAVLVPESRRPSLNNRAASPAPGTPTAAAQRRTPYDVVLMDLQMPVLDGIETVRRLRAAEAQLREKDGCERGGDPGLYPMARHGSYNLDGAADPAVGRPFHQLVIALSANSDEETRASAMEAGADAFMAKPFTYESFQTLLRSFEQ